LQISRNKDWNASRGAGRRLAQDDESAQELIHHRANDRFLQSFTGFVKQKDR
jgi:hypothetical protein